jgi:predicted Zn-ribbon and HTH transcriptional regulator
LINTAVVGLNPRQKEVIYARFGLDGGAGQTLAAIGEKLHVTRERVRQIENGAIVIIKRNIGKSDELEALLEKVKKFIAGKGGIAKKAEVVRFMATIAPGAKENQVDFLADASDVFHLYREDDAFHPFYYVTDKDLKGARTFVDGWVAFLKGRKEKVFAESYEVQLASFLRTKSFERPIADNYLSVSKQIQKNPYGDVGLREWPEISPSTVRDKIYLVLKKHGEPLHFENIAKHINKAKFDAELALAPTVHNELIKDERFVLVGRGLYGLQEHGYEPGTAREVIAKVLKTKGALNTAEVMDAVNKQRFFKPNTILINLQNRAFFERMNDGKYRVRES